MPPDPKWAWTRAASEDSRCCRYLVRLALVPNARRSALPLGVFGNGAQSACMSPLSRLWKPRVLALQFWSDDVCPTINVSERGNHEFFHTATVFLDTVLSLLC
jgi:hypothetical protein